MTDAANVTWVPQKYKKGSGATVDYDLISNEFL